MDESPEGQKVFIGADDWRNNAVLNYTHSTHELIIMGYKAAGDLLVEHAERGQDILVYPIVYLYRHYFELRLKSLIRAAKKLVDPHADEPSMSHNLPELWDALARYWPDLDVDPQDESLQTSKAVIEEFHRYDPGATSFRYGDERAASTIQDLQYVNLRHLAEQVELASGPLEGMEAWMSQLLQDQADMYAAYGPVPDYGRSDW